MLVGDRDNNIEERGPVNALINERCKVTSIAQACKFIDFFFIDHMVSSKYNIFHVINVCFISIH